MDGRSVPKLPDLYALGSHVLHDISCHLLSSRVESIPQSFEPGMTL